METVNIHKNRVQGVDVNIDHLKTLSDADVSKEIDNIFDLLPQSKKELAHHEVSVKIAEAKKADAEQQANDRDHLQSLKTGSAIQTAELKKEPIKTPSNALPAEGAVK